LSVASLPPDGLSRSLRLELLKHYSGPMAAARCFSVWICSAVAFAALSGKTGYG
jgi:hypothetical protein